MPTDELSDREAVPPVTRTEDHRRPEVISLRDRVLYDRAMFEETAWLAKPNHELYTLGVLFVA